MTFSPAAFQRFNYITFIEYQLIAGAMIMAALGVWNLHANIRGLTRISIIALSIYIIYLIENAGMLRWLHLPQTLSW